MVELLLGLEVDKGEEDDEGKAGHRVHPEVVSDQTVHLYLI